MEFSRIGEHTIKCIISEEEIEGLGYTLEEIMSNGERTQEFMNHIFELAEQKLEQKFNLGVKTVRADFMPDHTLVLTFSEHRESQMMEHLKDIVNGFLDSIPSDKWDELKKGSEAEQPGDTELPEQTEDVTEVVAIFKFSDMDVFMRFSRLVTLEQIPENMLYKYQGCYYLIMTLTNCTESEVLHLSVLTDEYADEVAVGPERKAFLEEHGERILAEHAIETCSICY